MMTFWAKVIEEAANSQEQELLRPRGDTGQVIAEKESQEFHQNLGRITEKTAGSPGHAAAGGDRALNFRASEVRKCSSESSDDLPASHVKTPVWPRPAGCH